MANTSTDDSPIGDDELPVAKQPARQGVVDREVPAPRSAPHRKPGSPPLSSPVDGQLPRVYLGLIAAVTLAGLLLRLPSFRNSLQGDEISTFYIVYGHSLGRVISLVYSRQETTPPLYFVLAWITKGWLGNPAQSIRLVSLITGTAAIPLTFLLGLWTVGRRAALVGATCVALSPFMIFFSTEARTYMLVLFLALSSSLCLLRALDTNRPVWWVGYALCSCGAVYSHYSVVFILVAQLAWAVWAVPQARRPLVIATAAAAVGFLPWINGFRADLDAPNFITYLVPVTPHNVTDILEHFWFGHPIIPVRVLPGDLALLLAVAGLALGAVGIAQSASKWRFRQISPRVLMVVTLAVAPAVMMVLYSLLRVDVLGAGNIIASWPAMALTIGAVVTAPPKPLRTAAVVLTVTAYAIGGVKMLSSTSQRGNVSAAVAFIERAGKSGDPIVTAPYFSNPLSEVDAALAGTPSWTYIPSNTLDRVRPSASDPHPVIRIGVPPLNEEFHFLAAPNPNPVFYGLPVPTPQQVAAEAKLLGRNGTVFLLSPYPANYHALLKYYPNLGVSQFIRAMEPGFTVVRGVTFPGWFGSESVYVFRRVKR
jgi:hypothetical protein